MVAVGYTGGDPNKLSIAGYVKGDVVAASAGGTLAVVHVGADGQVLESDSTAPDGVSWQTGGGGAGTPSNTVVTETTYGQSSTAGVAATYSRGDHTHGTPTAVTVPTASGSVVTEQSPGQAAVVGVATTFSRGDHSHGTVPLGGDRVFPLSGYGLTAVSFDPEHGMNGANIANTQAFFARVWIPAGVPINNLWCACRDAGTWDGVTTGSTIGVSTDAGVFIDKIVANDALWTTNSWVGGALSLGQIPAQSTGRFVYISPLVKGMSVIPTIGFLTSANDSAGNVAWFNGGPAGSGATNRRAFYMSGLSALPASFNPVSAGTATTFTVLVGVN